MRIALLALIGLFAWVHGSLAAWPTSPLENLPVSGSRYDQIEVRMCSDLAGGALVAWLDLRNGNSDFYGARIEVDGTQPWPYWGLALEDSVAGVASLAIDTDGDGGAVLAYKFGNIASSNIWVQRIDAAGNRLWGPHGILLTTASGSTEPRIVSDGQHGAIVIWGTCQFCTTAIVRAQ